MPQSAVPVLRAPTLAEQAYEYLLRKICAGTIPAAASLREMDLVAELKISRTPIREALIRLAEYGLIEMSGRSARVRTLGVRDVRQIHQVRIALELEAVRLASGKLTSEDFARLESLAPGPDLHPHTPEFDAACVELDMTLHRLIAERSKNPILLQTIRKLHDLTQLMHKPLADRGRIPQGLREHLEIIQALRSGDARGSRRAMRRHLNASTRSQLQSLKEQAHDQ